MIIGILFVYLLVAFCAEPALGWTSVAIIAFFGVINLDAPAWTRIIYDPTKNTDPTWYRIYCDLHRFFTGR